jgi:hypothetical protein
MVEIKQARSTAETIARRQRNSGGEEADQTIKTGDGERRTFHNIHLSGSAKQHGGDAKGEGNIFGQPRGPANRDSEI